MSYVVLSSPSRQLHLLSNLHGHTYDLVTSVVTQIHDCRGPPSLDSNSPRKTVRTVIARQTADIPSAS